MVSCWICQCELFVQPELRVLHVAFDILGTKCIFKRQTSSERQTSEREDSVKFACVEDDGVLYGSNVYEV